MDRHPGDGSLQLGRRCAALVLAGGTDTNAPAPMMRRMAERIPGAAYVCLDGAGHLANLERPAAFNRALRAFLSEHALSRESALP